MRIARGSHHVLPPHSRDIHSHTVTGVLYPPLIPHFVTGGRGLPILSTSYGSVTLLCL